MNNTSESLTSTMCGRHKLSTLNISRLAPMLLLCGRLVAQGGGVVSGTVVDEIGNPVPMAKVRLVDTPLRPMNTEKSFPADTDGKFLIANVKWGSYLLQAMKPEDGYPDPFLLFYGFKVFQPSVTVSPEKQAVNVVLPIGPKAGHLRIRVTDAVTKHPLDGATVYLLRADNEHVSASSTVTNDAALVPSQVPITIRIQLEGYRDWYFPGVAARGAARSTSLKPGEETLLNVALVPLPTN